MHYEILGYIASILIGVSLGLIGSGGSILTVPVLVYLFSVDAITATAYSLFIVGITAGAGSIVYLRRKLVQLRTVLFFGIPSLTCVYIARHLILPALPDIVYQSDSLVLHKGQMLLLLFAVLMAISASKMIRKNSPGQKNTSGSQQTFNYYLLAIRGCLVGLVTGLVGAGGGFLIIPSLVIWFQLRMQEAIGTSLVIILINSGFGFAIAYNDILVLDWRLLISVTLLALAGLWMGFQLGKKMDGAALKKTFGWFVLAMGVFIVLKELF